MTNYCKKIEKFFGHVERSLGNSAETFRQRSGRLSLKVRKGVWKTLKKKITFLTVLLWRSKLVLTTCLKDFNDCSKKCAHSPERTKSFLTKFFVWDMFILACGIQFGPPCLEWYMENTKKCSLDVRKKSENVKFLSKLFFYLPLWRQIADLITRLQNFRRNSEIFSPTVGIYSKKPTMFSSKFSSGRVSCVFDNSVEKFWQISNNFASKTKLNWKTNMFFIKIPQKVLGTLKMQYQQKWRNFFFKTNIFFAWVRSLKKNMRTIHKKIKKVLPTRKMHVWKRCWNF